MVNLSAEAIAGLRQRIAALRREAESAPERNRLIGLCDELDDAVKTLSVAAARSSADSVEVLSRALLEAAPDGVVTIDHAGSIMLVNGQAEKLFGYERDELLGQPIEVLIPERYRGEHVGHRSRYIAAPHTRPMGPGLDLWGLRKDRSEFPVEISLSAVQSEDGLLVTSIVRDVTDRKRIEAQQALLLRIAESAEERFRTLVESAPDAVVTVGSDGTIALVNSQTEKLFGYAREELIGQPIEVLVPEQFRGMHVSHRDGYMTEPRTRPMGAGLELRARRKDGSEFPVEISLAPVGAETGGLITSIVRDVTERKRAQENLEQTAAELERSNHELEQFAYVASHDLQEPLRMIASYTQLLARRYTGRLDSDADEFIGFAVEGANRMQALIRDLLHYASVGSQARPLERTDSGLIVDRVVDELTAAVHEHEATVSRGDLPTVSADPVQLGQLFQNLVSNAIKFRGQQPTTVQISATRMDKEWRFAVSDNGIGIDPEFRDRIFVIFQRLHRTTEYPGTGIGLAICKKIVERHGGRIWIESQPGQGATFYFTLPVLDADGQ